MTTVYRNSAIVTAPDGHTYQCMAWNGTPNPPPGPGWVKLCNPWADELHRAMPQERDSGSLTGNRGAGTLTHPSNARPLTRQRRRSRTHGGEVSRKPRPASGPAGVPQTSRTPPPLAQRV